ncbi:uroplakin-3b-like protein 1 [Marmota marmota marmota]|uniref:uroplakin-3b-like protein 1 n=1 Tax=Marmota marmota marmota TaxID=9994 RepID=UPI0020937338|nr:uroplakin-3b-like protein 1 [Marmota marmota marmota]
MAEPQEDQLVESTMGTLRKKGVILFEGSCIPSPVPFPEHISYMPRLSSVTLAGKLTQSTFTLEQPLGLFDDLNISNSDPIWLVVAHSNAIQNFTVPQKTKDIPAPANFSQKGYYLTLRANQKLYRRGGQASKQLPVLRVGNDTHCSWTKVGCNHPLQGSGPYRVKFLVMSKEGPVAETEWSKETRLQQAQVLQAVTGPQSAGTVVIIAILSVLLAILLAAVLIMLTQAYCESCRNVPVSIPEEPLSMGRYSTHHMGDPSAVGGS